MALSRAMCLHRMTKGCRPNLAVVKHSRRESEQLAGPPVPSALRPRAMASAWLGSLLPRCSNDRRSRSVSWAGASTTTSSAPISISAKAAPKLAGTPRWRSAAAGLTLNPAQQRGVAARIVAEGASCQLAAKLIDRTARLALCVSMPMLGDGRSSIVALDSMRAGRTTMRAGSVQQAPRS